MKANNESLENKVEAFKRNYKGTVKIDSTKNVLKINGSNLTLSQNFDYNGNKISFEVGELRRIVDKARSLESENKDLKRTLREVYTAAVYDKITQYEERQNQAYARKQEEKEKLERRDNRIAVVGLGIAAITAAALTYLPFSQSEEVPYKELQKPKKAVEITIATKEPKIEDRIEEIQRRLDATIAKIVDIDNRKIDSAQTQYSDPRLVANPILKPEPKQIPIAQPQNSLTDLAQDLITEEDTTKENKNNQEESRKRRWSEMGTKYLEMAITAMEGGRIYAGSALAKFAGRYFRL